MPKQIALEDDGFLEVTFRGVAKPIDLYRVNNRLADLQAQYKGRSDDYFEAVLDLMEEYGLPVKGAGDLFAASHRLADVFVQAVVLAMGDLRKKLVAGGDETSPASLATTGPVLSEND